jgi:hypothetical protein
MAPQLGILHDRSENYDSVNSGMTMPRVVDVKKKTSVYNRIIDFCSRHSSTSDQSVPDFS